MNFEQIQILTKILGEYDLTKGNEELMFYCPFCNHKKKKLAINKNGKWHCWVCNKVGKSPNFIVEKFGTPEQIDNFSICSFGLTPETVKNDIHTQDSIELELPIEYKTFAKNRLINAENYLLSRGLSLRDATMFKLGFCTSGRFKNRIIVPSFNRDGKLNFFVARDFTNKNPLKLLNCDIEKNSIFFNELYVDWDKEINIVEGPFDYLKTPNAACLLGSSLHRESQLFVSCIKNAKSINLILDSDAIKKAKLIAKLLFDYGKEVYITDVRKASLKDIGMAKKEDVPIIIKKYKNKFDLKTLLTLGE